MPDTQLNNALSEISLWPVQGEQNAEPIELSGGLTNRSFLLSIEGKKYRLRLNNPFSNALGINRQREKVITDALHKAELAPALVYSGEAYDYSLFEYIEGRTWSEKDFDDPYQKEKLIQLITLFQKLHIDSPARDYRAYLNHYWLQIKDQSRLTDNEYQKYLEFDTFLKSHAKTWPKSVLCHHDLIPENIIETKNGLKIIDWEYAAIGHPELDEFCIDLYSNKTQITLTETVAKSEQILKPLVFWLNKLWEEVSRIHSY